MNDSAEMPRKRSSKGEKRMGRPSKSAQILDRMAIAYAPESIYPLLFEKQGADEGQSIAKLAGADFGRLYRKARKNLETLLDQASSRDGMSRPTHEALAKLRERAVEDSPESIINACNQEMELNESLITALIGHLINHIIVGEELRFIADTARSRVGEGLKTAAPVYIGLINSLKAAGVVENNVRDMSKSQFIEILAILKKTSGDEQKRVISEVSEGREVVPAIFKEGFEDGVAPGEQANASGVAPAKEEVSPSLVSNDAEEGHAIADAAAKNTIVHDPRGLWDTLDLAPIGYRIEEAEPSTVADKEALSIILPGTRVLADWAVRGTQEHMFAEACVRQRDRILLEKFLKQHSERTGRVLPEMEKRIVSMLMIDLQPADVTRLTGKDGWFDGTVLPPKAGSSKVRRVLAINNSAAAMTAAYRPDDAD